MLTLTAAEILATLDLDAVEAAILNDENGKPQLLAHEFQDCKAMVWTACEKWLVSDLDMLDAATLGIEEEFNIQLGGCPVRGFLDIRGQYTKGYEDTGGSLKGRVLIADWKTTSGDLDAIWQSRLVDSKQWKLYSVVPPSADFVTYRGVNAKGKTREVYLKAYTVPDRQQHMEEYFGGVWDMIKSLATRDTWPQNRPHACGLFGSTCPFKGDCERDAAPRYLLPVEEIALSYSGAGRMLTCPEKFRRIKRAEAGIDGTDATRTGSCVHSGLEEIYRQSFHKYGT